MHRPSLPNLRRLRRLTQRARAGALEAALPVAGPDEFDTIAGDLIEIMVNGGATASGLTALAGVWPCLAAPARDRIRQVATGRWEEIGAALAHDGFAPRRAALADLAASVPDTGLAPWLAGLLMDREPSVRRAAEGTLLGLVSSAARTGSPEWGSAAEAAVAGAAGSYDEHRSSAAILALVRLLAGSLHTSPGGPVAAIVADGSHPVHGAARQLIRRSPREVSAADAWRLMRHDAWTPACLERIAQSPTESEGGEIAHWPELFPLHHLLAHPVRSAALRRLAGRSGPFPILEALAQATRMGGLSPGARCGVPRWLSAAAIRPADFDRLAAPLLTDGSPLVRHAVLRAAADRHPAVRPVLLDLCFDSDPRCARSAALALAPWRRTGVVADAPLDGAARALRRSPHPGVRELAAAVRVDPADWFAGDARARLAAREALARDRGKALAEVRRRLHGSDEAAVSACALADSIALVPDLETELLTMLRTTGQRGRAAASGAAALGSGRTESSLAALLALLDAPDPRVRANALDAMVRRARLVPPGDDPRHVPALSASIELKADPAHRVRAGAIRGMLLLVPARPGSCQAAVAALGAMLADERPMHRLSALWLAERAAPDGQRDGWGEIACRATALWRDDPEIIVRSRAGRCATALLGRMRSDWASRAAGSCEMAEVAR